jgi:hypothetical protein
MRISATLPEHGSIVEAVLDGFVQAAQIIIEAGVVPTHPRDGGVVYQEERGTENWLLPNQVIAAGWGDCEDLAIWAAAGYRATGEDPEARVALLQTGPRRVHAVVRRGDGSYEDVARSLVMRGSSLGSVVGAARAPYGGTRGGYPTTRIRVHQSDGTDAFAGLPPAAAPPGGGTPTSAASQATAAIANWMEANGRTDLSINNNYTPGHDVSPPEFQALAGRLAAAMRQPDYEPRNLDNLNLQMRAQQGMANADNVGDTYDPSSQKYGVSVRDANPSWAQQQVDPQTGLTIDPATGLPIDPYTGLPMDPYGYGGQYGGYGYSGYPQSYAAYQGQQDFDYQAMSAQLYGSAMDDLGGVTGYEQQPWQVDVDGDGDVDNDDDTPDWIGGVS